jgi:hypothetical protein
MSQHGYAIDHLRHSRLHDGGHDAAQQNSSVTLSGDGIWRFDPHRV